MTADARSLAAAWEPWLGAVVTWVERAHGEGPQPSGAGPLAGLRLGVKDLLAVAGVPRGLGVTGGAGAALQPADAEAVVRLVAGGATVVATLATHQYAYGIVTPQTRNPRAPDRIAGGSSGGPAAALAAGIVDVALGTDTGGSVRIPAACCGVVGLKTTHGVVPVDGVHPLAPSLDSVGPLARDVATCAAAMSLLAPDLPPPQPRGVSPGHPDRASERHTPASGGGAGWRVGVPVQTGAERLDAEIRSAWEASLAALEAGSATLVDVDLPTLPRTSTANGRLLAHEAATVHGARFRTEPGHFAADVGPRIAGGLALEPAKLARAREVRRVFAAEAAEAFATVDVLCTPTLPCRAPLVGRDPIVVDGHSEPLVPTMTRHTNPWNLIGLPAGSVPVARDDGGAPIGVQLIGPARSEHTVLAVMAALEAAVGGPWPVATPPETHPT